jgi:predicted RNA-binding protein YlxR (DUF448 family)
MAKIAHQPIRSCVGCGKKQSPKLMLRVASHQGAAPAVDVSQNAVGRGAYVCFDAKCVDKAIVRKAFERSLKVKCGLSQSAKDEIKSVVEATSSTRSV